MAHTGGPECPASAGPRNASARSAGPLGVAAPLTALGSRSSKAHLQPCSCDCPKGVMRLRWASGKWYLWGVRGGGEGGNNQKAWKWLPCGTSHCTIPGARGHFIQCERRLWVRASGCCWVLVRAGLPLPEGAAPGPSLGLRSPCARETGKLKIPKETKEEWEVVNHN